jgi:hypothetical protein
MKAGAPFPGSSKLIAHGPAFKKGTPCPITFVEPPDARPPRQGSERTAFRVSPGLIPIHGGYPPLLRLPRGLTISP